MTKWVCVTKWGVTKWRLYSKGLERVVTLVQVHFLSNFESLLSLSSVLGLCWSCGALGCSNQDRERRRRQVVD